jgi:hypothetical protein
MAITAAEQAPLPAADVSRSLTLAMNAAIFVTALNTLLLTFA